MTFLLKVQWIFEEWLVLEIFFFHFQSDYDKINILLVLWEWYTVLTEGWTSPFLPRSSIFHVAPIAAFSSIFLSKPNRNAKCVY